jgi:hypothetical protein
MNKGRLFTIAVLGSTQTLAWASSYYLPAVLADDIARDTGVSTTWLFAVFSVSLVHGSGNGILTIARGTVPLALFGPENYGYRLGLIGLPSRFLSALAPLCFAVLLEQMSAQILIVSAGLSLAALAALCALRPAPATLHAG